MPPEASHLKSLGFNFPSEHKEIRLKKWFSTWETGRGIIGFSPQRNIFDHHNQNGGAFKI